MSRWSECDKALRAVSGYASFRRGSYGGNDRAERGPVMTVAMGKWTVAKFSCMKEAPLRSGCETLTPLPSPTEPLRGTENAA